MLCKKGKRFFRNRIECKKTKCNELSTKPQSIIPGRDSPFCSFFRFPAPSFVCFIVQCFIVCGIGLVEPFEDFVVSFIDRLVLRVGNVGMIGFDELT